MCPQFGSKVVGAEEYDRAVRNEEGGGHVFGVRVRDAIPDSGPTNQAKRAVEHGIKVVMDAQQQDTKGNVTDTLPIDELRRILGENPTFFDSLYEAELARVDGARREALEIFYEVERGIKGQMRADVMGEIRQLLDQKKPASAARADEAILERRRMQQQLERQDANTKDGVGIGQADVNLQLNEIAKDMGITREGQVTAQPTTDTKTSDKGLDPNGTGAKAGTNLDTSADSSETDTGSKEINFDDYTVAELQDHLGDDAVAKIEGSGADGRVLKADLVKAAKKAEKAKK